jgi:hypothetical protein
VPILKDARGNEFQGWLDQITGGTVTDARVITSTLSALNAEAVMDLNGQSVALFDLRTGAMSATLVFEGTVDNVNYFGLPGLDLLTETMLAAVIVTTTLAKTYAVGCSGLRRIRVRVSAFTSGTMTAALRATRGDVAIYARPIPATLAVTVTAAANAAATLTLPAAGAGLFHYITALHIARTATAALAGTATLVITTTNLPGSMAFSVGNAMAAGGTQRDIEIRPANAIKSSVANTATTVVMPAPGAAVLWRAYVFYYVGA